MKGGNLRQSPVHARTAVIRAFVCDSERATTWLIPYLSSAFPEDKIVPHENLIHIDETEKTGHFLIHKTDEMFLHLASGFL